MTEALPNGSTRRPIRHREVEAGGQRAADGRQIPARLSHRYFDVAGFRGRTLGLDVEGGKQKTAGK